MEETLNTIVLVDDEGIEEEFEVILEFTLEDDGKTYYVFESMDREEDDEDYYLDVCYKLTNQEEEEFYFVEDPEELEMVQEVLDLVMSQE